MNGLFGVELPTAVNFVIAFVVVLVLIGLTAWLVRRLGGTRIEAAARGRQPRLAVIDSAAVDSRRKLVIVRRDNIEHLLMIGGPTDVVVETNIVRAGATATREQPPARAGNGEAAARPMPSADNTWPLQPEPAPAPIQPMRAAPRMPAAEDPLQWDEPIEPAAQPAPLRAVRPADTIAGLAAELSQPPRSRIDAGYAPQSNALTAQAITASDQSLAEMAQRLEAALRRPAPAKMAVEAAPAPAADGKPASRAGQRAAATQPKALPQPAPSTPQGALEKEMASLLGRPGKT